MTGTALRHADEVNWARWKLFRAARRPSDLRRTGRTTLGRLGVLLARASWTAAFLGALGHYPRRASKWPLNERRPCVRWATRR